VLLLILREPISASTKSYGITNVVMTQRKWQKNLVAFGPSSFLGLTMLLSGTGKLAGTMEFVSLLLGSFLTPLIAFLIGYCLPWLEFILGMLLLLGVFARIAAALCLPLTIGFMATNSWLLSRGVKDSSCYYCFGKWEEIFWSLSPLQSLCLDIVLLLLAIVIVLFYPRTLFDWRPWFIAGRVDKDATSESGTVI